MKKTNVLCMIIVTVMLMGLFSGCAQKKTEISTKFAYQTYLQPLIPTGRLFRYNWDSPSEIKPDDLVNFAAYNNLLELPTEPAGQKICDGASYIDNMAPAEQLEKAVLQYFSVDAQQLHQSSFYDAGAECYTLFSGWGGEYGASVTDVSQEGDILTLKIGEGNFGQPQKEPLGELKVRIVSEKKWEYLSYRFEKEIKMGNLNEQERLEWQQKYLFPLIPTGHMYTYGWDSVQEILPDDLVNFCAYNNLLNLPVTPEDLTIVGGAEYVQKEAQAEAVEEAIRQYFDVDAKQLRQSQFYHPDRNAYTMLCGFGGGYGMQLMGGYTEGNMMYLQVGEGGVEEQPVYTGTLKIKQIDESNWKYVSYQKENWSYIGETLSVRK